MSRLVTVVMYHFVRDLEGSRYPKIKGLDVSHFDQQVAYLLRHYNVISMQELVAAAKDSAAPLPERPLLLTFDDGYIDHFTCVFPILSRYGVPGAFFPPAKAILERRVLDVNKIHFLLAAVDDTQVLVEEIKRRIVEEGPENRLEKPEYYFRRCTGDHRYDPPEVTFVKRALQRELPEAYRAQLTDALFSAFVSDDEASFANELYMSEEQLACLVRHGMYVGSHGYAHYWLNTVDKNTQSEEVRKGLEFIASVGTPLEDWVMCYPYGGYDDSLIEVLKEAGCGLALTADAAIADLDNDGRFVIPRLDTNDLPKQADAMPNSWTQQVINVSATEWDGSAYS